MFRTICFPLLVISVHSQTPSPVHVSGTWNNGNNCACSPAPSADSWNNNPNNSSPSGSWINGNNYGPAPSGENSWNNNPNNNSPSGSSGTWNNGNNCPCSPAPSGENSGTSTTPSTTTLTTTTTPTTTIEVRQLSTTVIITEIKFEGMSATEFKNKKETIRNTIAIMLGVDPTMLVISVKSTRRSLYSTIHNILYFKGILKFERRMDNVKVKIKIPRSLGEGDSVILEAKIFVTPAEAEVMENKVVALKTKTEDLAESISKATGVEVSATVKDPVVLTDQTPLPEPILLKSAPTVSPSSSGDTGNSDNDGDGSGSSTSTSEKNGDNATGLIVGIIAGILVLVGFLMFYLNKNKRNKNKLTNLTEIPDDVEMKTQKKMVELSKIEGVELSMNPMNSGNKNNVAHMKNVDYVISKKPPTHLKHISPDGKAYFQEIGTNNTVWKLPEDGVLNE